MGLQDVRLSLLSFSLIPMPTSTMVEMLIPIWQRVLQLSSVGVNDNFFEVGGDSALALDLFYEIAQASGRELPPVMICQAPTITALAALLEQPTAPRLSPVALLKAGTETPPVFIAHGIGGSVMDFFPLARDILSPHSIYGMQAKGMDGLEDPLESIEEMAEFYLDSIRQLQPRGPYLLIGFSLGGLQMLEVAQRLSISGEKVSLLAMLDSYPHRRYLPFGEHTRLIAHLARRRISGWRSAPMREAISRIARHRVNERSQSATSKSFAEAAGRVRDKAALALAHYRPQYYCGKIKFVRAEISSYFPEDPVAVWGHLASELDVETVPGDHVAMIAAHFEHLGSVLSRYLAEACS
jgi:thioesterase domain-containing protein